MHNNPSRETSIGYLVHEVARSFRRRFEDAASQHDITLPQWKVISELKHRGNLPQVALAAAVDSDPMTLSKILERLEKRGLISREADPVDSRAKVVSLSPDGEALFATAKTLGGKVYEAALEGISDAERAAIIAGLVRIRSNLNSISAEPKDGQ